MSLTTGCIITENTASGPVKAVVTPNPDRTATVEITATTESGTFTKTVTLVPMNTPESPCSSDILRITKDDIDKAGGTMEKYLRTEDKALLLARVAMGEATESAEERIRVMWLLKIRIELGYMNADQRTFPTNAFLMSHWGPKSDIYKELLVKTEQSGDYPQVNS